MKKLFCFIFIVLFSFSVLADPEFIYPEDTGRDPFDALVNEDGVVNMRLVRAEGDLLVNGIVYSESASERMVIINSEVLHEGDVIGAYSIANIFKNKIVLLKGTKKIELKMEEESED